MKRIFMRQKCCWGRTFERARMANKMWAGRAEASRAEPIRGDAVSGLVPSGIRGTGSSTLEPYLAHMSVAFLARTGKEIPPWEKLWRVIFLAQALLRILSCRGCCQPSRTRYHSTPTFRVNKRVCVEKLFTPCYICYTANATVLFTAPLEGADRADIYLFIYFQARVVTADTAVPLPCPALPHPALGADRWLRWRSAVG